MDKLWTPLEPEHIANPYPMYKKLREHSPIYQAQTGEWIITKYQHVKEIYKSPLFAAGNRLAWLDRGTRYFAEKNEDISAIHEALQMFLNLQNPPHHTRIRNLVGKAWQQYDVDGLILDNIDFLIQQFPGNSFDFIHHFAQPLPVLTISKILGLPPEDYRHLKALGSKLTEALALYTSLNDLKNIHEAAREMILYFRSQLHHKAQHPNQSLISKILNLNAREPEPLNERELISLCIFLFNAGEETTSNLLGAGLYHLMHYPQQFETLRKQPDLIVCAVEELLRFDPSVQIAGKVCTSDYTIDNQVIPKDAVVSLVIGSANRDPEVFDNPDTLNVTRTPNRHLTFGSGIHYCMGDWLARRQAQLALLKLMEKFKNIEMETGSAVWNRLLTFRSLNTMTITVS